MHNHIPSTFLLFCTLALLCTGVGHAQESQTSPSGEIAVSEESLQLRYVRPWSAPGSNVEAGQLGFGMFLNEERDIVASANYYVEASRLRMNRLNIQVGPVAYAALLSEENTDVFALGLGAEARYRLLRNPEVTIVGRAVYAPDILTFGAADNVWDVIGRAEVPITNRVTGFGGFRLFEIDLVEGKTELEESIHFGLRYRF